MDQRPFRLHAVVVGAGMGGLLAARVLADAYERVTIVERDALPPIGEDRKGVPQGHHVHVLLARGAEILEELFPGLTDRLVAGGATVADHLSEVRLSIGGQQLCREPLGVPGVLMSRPFLEGHVRRRVRELPNVDVVESCDVVGPLTPEDVGRVSGVRILRRTRGSAEELMPADLVVDSSGRSGRTLAWLDDLNFERPAEDKLRIDLAYVTRHLRLPDGATGDDKLVVVGAAPGRPRGMALAREEGDRWALTLLGYGRDHHPPTGLRGFMAFADSVCPPDLWPALEAATPLDNPVLYRFPSELRRRYELLPRFPEGLLVTGDALCSFNPHYGQGMTVAALEALALRHCLADAGGADPGRGDVDCGLSHRFFAAAAQAVEPAWQLAVGGDLALPEVDGDRPSPIREANAYLERVRRAAGRDATVARAFLEVAGMLRSPDALFQPAIVSRVLHYGGPG
jgi:2-polyprenyl-6-methoxyphenol hydroxylase-like FAD-dependent oxidoreductase